MKLEEILQDMVDDKASDVKAVRRAWQRAVVSCGKDETVPDDNAAAVHSRTGVFLRCPCTGTENGRTGSGNRLP